MLSRTIAAFKPIDDPTKARVKGIIQTIRIINGIDRNMFTKKEIVLFNGRLASNCRSRVKNNKMPNGNPSRKLKNPDVNVIAIVSKVPFASNQNVASDISIRINQLSMRGLTILV